MPIALPPALVPVGQVICTMPGAYSFLGTKSSTSATGGNSTTRASAIFVAEPVLLDRIGCEVTGAGEAGCVVRLGIWADAGNVALAGALVLDAGTIAADSIGVKEITIARSLPAGTYWLSGTVQGAPATQPTLRTAGGGTEPVMSYHGGGAAVLSAATGLGTSRTDAGALAATWGTSYFGNIGSLPRIFVRVA